MINTVTIVGNIGQDPEIRYTASGMPVASFTVAVNEVYKGKDGQKVKRVHWFRVTAFQRLAEIVGEYCTKGSKVGIRGQLQYRQWQDNEGLNHNIVEIRARELELLSGKNGNPATTEEDIPAAPEDDDIPVKSVASTTGLIFRRTFSIFTMPYRAIVFKVRDRLLLLRPVADSNSFNDSGFRSRMVFSSNWFSLLRSWAMDCSDSNQILGSSGCGWYSPLAMDRDRFL